MPDASHIQRGQAAEARVDRTARARGWRCVARNYSCRGGELDLVYTDQDWLIVVEVRYRARSDYGHAAATVRRSKQRRIILSTRHFLLTHPQYDQYAVRFDVVGVDGNNTLDWIEGAFYAE